MRLKEYLIIVAFTFTPNSGQNVDFDAYSTLNLNSSSVDIAPPLKPKLKTNLRILNGRSSSIKSHPHQISLQTWANGSLSHVCGGSILDKSWIITAAHCLNNTRAVLKIRAGSTNQREGGQVIQVKSGEIHPSFAQRKGGPINDIAVVKLVKPLKFNKRVQPIRLATKVSKKRQTKGETSGWGRFCDKCPLTDQLQDIDVTVLAEKECSDALSGKLHGSFICVYKKNSSACKGDSGGPLVSSKGLLLGVASFILKNCESGNPVVYSSIPYARDWINSQTASDDIFSFL